MKILNGWKQIAVHLKRLIVKLMKSVLLADDNAFILETIAARIRKNGILVITTSNGQEAIDRAILAPPDLAILDVSMPVMNGLDAASRLHEIMPSLPIILFTSFANILRTRTN